MPPWLLQNSVDAVVFDCDGTLSQIEGIDWLAAQNGVGDKVRALTEKAMGATGITPALYAKRLELVQPTAEQLEQLGARYYTHLTPDVDRVIAILQRLHKAIYVVSAGIRHAVEDFAARLHIPKHCVSAVEVYFDKKGRYAGYDESSPMTQTQGKRAIVSTFQKKHARLAYVGDGLNDTEVIDQVNRFIGYGGAYFRESIAKRCEFYVLSRSLLPVLPLMLTEVEREALLKEDRAIFQAGLSLIQSGQVRLQSSNQL